MSLADLLQTLDESVASLLSISGNTKALWCQTCACVLPVIEEQSDVCGGAVAAEEPVLNKAPEVWLRLCHNRAKWKIGRPRHGKNLWSRG